MDDKGVKDSETPSEEQEQEQVEQQPEGAVTPQATDDRPEKNIAMEFNRKFGKLQSQLDTVLNYIATQQQPKPVEQPKPEKELSDEELWTLAQQGDRQAYVLHQQRIADRQYRQHSAVDQRKQMVASQLQALIARYPVLNDGSHPLTQKAILANNALMAQGYPQSPETLLEATKTAIADSPELIAELHGSGADMNRRGPAAAQSGASHRQAAPPPQNKPKALTPDQLRIAKQMGVKDPQGSKARFLKRQEDGTSNFGSIGMIVKAEDV